MTPFQGIRSLTRAVVALVVVALASACASTPQPEITLADKVVSIDHQKIGVAVERLPKVDTAFPGASCLLCLAVAAGANSTLTTHVHTLKPEGLAELRTSVAESLRKAGADAIVIPDELNIAELKAFPGAKLNFAYKDLRPLAEKYQVKYLFLIEFYEVGVSRPYAAYVPTGDPAAVVRGDVMLVDLSTNGYGMFQRISITKTAEGEWKEPPSYPGLTNAFYQALEAAKDAVNKTAKP